MAEWTNKHTGPYIELLDAWNARSVEAFAALFAEDGNVVGFDGSAMNGRPEAAQQLTEELQALL